MKVGYGIIYERGGERERKGRCRKKGEGKSS